MHTVKKTLAKVGTALTSLVLLSGSVPIMNFANPNLVMAACQ
ncbi:hypothetical protein [Lactobacillus sp. ESL0677]|nr:hypothetical protein [Lactobacillus sp. ESL0677]WEV37561.1 hypothetical protein OZX76_03130 [Lactobacillus sp. ESL0677]